MPKGKYYFQKCIVLFVAVTFYVEIKINTNIRDFVRVRYDFITKSFLNALGPISQRDLSLDLGLNLRLWS